MAIVKSEGVTPTERLLANLCERSFLKLWSYPNPLKDDGDELCDLLAVFENRVFIFFDRVNLSLSKKNNDPTINWNRWKKKVIDAQTRTAHGAERYIRSGNGIFLDNALKVPFPIDIDRKNVIIHKIIIAHGAKEACEKSSDDNVYGSLGISYGNNEIQFPVPFIIHIDKENPVHVLDSHNLPIIFGELDTIFDFSSYFDAKIDAIKSLDLLVYCGEEDLLAHYFLNYDTSKKKHFIGTSEKNIDSLMIGEGEWKDYIDLKMYKDKKYADEVSYFWDDIIQKTSQNALNGTLVGSSTPFSGKSAIHEMAKEPRYCRRALSEIMIKAINGFPESTQRIMRNLSFMSSFYEEKAYVFLQLKIDGIAVHENEYRPKRTAMLKIACGAAKNKFDYLKTVIGIAIYSPKHTNINSEDFVLMDCDGWTDDLREQFEKENKGLNFFCSGTATTKKMYVKEFPVTED